MNKFLGFAALSALCVPAIAFQPGMSASLVNAEAAQRVARTESLNSIAAAEFSAGVPSLTAQSSLLAAGGDPQAVFVALVNAGYDPAALLPPTAAGSGNAGAVGGGFTGFAGNSNFGTSHASTLVGGGKSGVSRN